MTTQSATPRLDGRLGRDDAGRYTLRFTRLLPAPPEQAWEALVSPAGMTAWAPYTPDHRLDVLGPVTLTWTNSDQTPSAGQVLEVDAPYRLVMDWGGGALLHWTLVAVPDGTELALVHVFDNRPEAPSYGAGWEVCLTALIASLAGGTPTNPGGSAAVDNGWQELYDEYTVIFDGR